MDIQDIALPVWEEPFVSSPSWREKSKETDRILPHMQVGNRGHIHNSRHKEVEEGTQRNHHDGYDGAEVVVVVRLSWETRPLELLLLLYDDQGSSSDFSSFWHVQVFSFHQWMTSKHEHLILLLMPD